MDSFREGSISVIVASEITNILWIFYSLLTLLINILHFVWKNRHVGFKNLVFPTTIRINNAIIIDFEKVLFSLGSNIEKLISSFSENEHLHGIAGALQERLIARRNIPRKASMRGKKHKTRKH